MNKRDLKADLDWMMKSSSDHAKELEIAVHALERAIEAESLVRDLVEALGMVLEEMANCGFEVEEIFDPEKVVHAFGVFEKTKEVLGECSTANNAE